MGSRRRRGGLSNTLTGHSDYVRSVCFSPDSRLLASASLDNSVKLWDVKTGKCLVTFYTFEPHTWLAFTPEKFFNGTEKALSHIQFVDNLAIYPAREFKNQFHHPEKIKEILSKFK